METQGRKPLFLFMKKQVKATRTYIHDGEVIVRDQIFSTTKADELIRNGLAVECVEEKQQQKRRKEKDGEH